MSGEEVAIIDADGCRLVPGISSWELRIARESERGGGAVMALLDGSAGNAALSTRFMSGCHVGTEWDDPEGEFMGLRDAMYLYDNIPPASEIAFEAGGEVA